VKYWFLQRSILVTLQSLEHINGLSGNVNIVAELIFFADDTSIVISNSIMEEFKISINLVMKQTVVFKELFVFEFQ